MLLFIADLYSIDLYCPLYLCESCDGKIDHRWSYTSTWFLNTYLVWTLISDCFRTVSLLLASYNTHLNALFIRHCLKCLSTYTEVYECKSCNYKDAIHTIHLAVTFPLAHFALLCSMDSLTNYFIFLLQLTFGLGNWLYNGNHRSM